jgi:hypothetical protein
VSTYQFERDLRLPHDMITPGTPNVPMDLVYDRLIEQVQKLHQSPFPSRS